MPWWSYPWSLLSVEAQNGFFFFFSTVTHKVVLSSQQACAYWILCSLHLRKNKTFSVVVNCDRLWAQNKFRVGTMYSSVIENHLYCRTASTEVEGRVPKPYLFHLAQ